MKITKEKHLPAKRGWIVAENYSVEIKGKKYYGLLSKVDAEQTLKKQKVEECDRLIELNI